jgi:lipid A ethanolaminephosphotransferase
MLAWLPDGAAGVDRACLERRRHDPVSHDHLFHSVLGLFGVRTEIYSRELDLFAPCRARPEHLLTGR